MADNSPQFQGRFIADGTAEVIKLRADVDWFETLNYTVVTAGGAGTAVITKWQRGFADGAALVYTKLAADESMSPDTIATLGYTYVNTGTSNKLGAINATISAISAAAIPIVSAASTTTLVAGDIVRFVD